MVPFWKCIDMYPIPFKRPKVYEPACPIPKRPIIHFNSIVTISNFQGTLLDHFPCQLIQSHELWQSPSHFKQMCTVKCETHYTIHTVDYISQERCAVLHLERRTEVKSSQLAHLSVCGLGCSWAAVMAGLVKLCNGPHLVTSGQRAARTDEHLEIRWLAMRHSRSIKLVQVYCKTSLLLQHCLFAHSLTIVISNKTLARPNGTCVNI